MLQRHLGAAFVVSAALLTAGCSCSRWCGRPCTTPAVVGAVPAAPAPCAPQGAPVQPVSPPPGAVIQPAQPY
jgi:hypothetical protein